MKKKKQKCATERKGFEMATLSLKVIDKFKAYPEISS